MAWSEELLNDLAARTIIQGGVGPDSFLLVTIPDVDSLSMAERNAVFERAQQRQTGEIINQKLLELTPSIDEEAEREEDQRLEIQARKELEDAGCPPCYPRDLDLTTQDVPEEFQPIVDYWSQGPPWERLILCAQNLDYKEFRRYQLHTRSRLRHKNFPDFEEEVLRRRQKYGLHGNVHLLPDFKQHSQLQNWIEFQDFHLRKLEQVETKQEEFRQKLSSEPKEGIDSNIPYLESGLETVAWEIEQCKILLKWTEQQRQVMEPNTATCVGEGDVMTPGDSSRSRKFDPTSTSTSLDDTETAKVLPKKQGQRSWQGVRGIAEDRYTSPQAASIDTESHLSKEAEVSIHRVCSQGVRGSANSRSPRHNKEHTRPRSLASSSHCSSSIQRSKRTPPPATSRRVSKARANEAKSPGATQSEKHKALSGQGQSKHATKTRSGRISKKPLRWTPNA